MASTIINPTKEDYRNLRHAEAQRKKERGKTPEQLGYKVTKARKR